MYRGFNSLWYKRLSVCMGEKLYTTNTHDFFGKCHTFAILLPYFLTYFYHRFTIVCDLSPSVFGRRYNRLLLVRNFFPTWYIFCIPPNQVLLFFISTFSRDLGSRLIIVSPLWIRKGASPAFSIHKFRLPVSRL